jgi:hypothetical protein
MASNKKRKSHTPTVQTAISPKRYIKEVARKLPIHEVWLDDSIYKVGMGFVIVSRIKKNGEVVFGTFLIDTYCLGVKDAFCNIVPREEYDEYIAGINEREDSNLLKKEANYIFNLIYGAQEYAEDLGFEPHKDFDVAQYILDSVESIEYEEIEFGKDGKPCYMAGPDDKVGRILGILNRSVGEDGYTFVAPPNDIDDDFSDDDFAEWEEE